MRSLRQNAWKVEVAFELKNNEPVCEQEMYFDSGRNKEIIRGRKH